MKVFEHIFQIRNAAMHNSLAIRFSSVFGNVLNVMLAGLSKMHTKRNLFSFGTVNSRTDNFNMFVNFGRILCRQLWLPAS